MIRKSLLAALLCGVFANSASPFDDPGSREPPAILAPAEHRRGEEQTFLTFPEWFLVFSPAEYAQFVREHTPDEFVFWGHIHQFWQGYAAVARETHARGNPPNWGYHLMIVVIGTSTTVEYVARSAYETIIGRLAALTARGLTPEDRYGARVAQEYVDFIRYKPWYRFDFAGRLRGLWTDTDFFGHHLLRKWERKYALSTEYGVKAVYGWLIGLATGSIYDAPREVTSVAVNRWPACSGEINGVAVLRRMDAGAALLTVPRYEGFRSPVVALARCGVNFQEIAGNRTVILVSTLESTGVSVLAKSLVLLRQPVLTQPGRERVVYVIPVAALAQSLRAFEAAGASVELEHIFDY